MLGYSPKPLGKNMKKYLVLSIVSGYFKYHPIYRIESARGGRVSRKPLHTYKVIWYWCNV